MGGGRRRWRPSHGGGVERRRHGGAAHPLIVPFTPPNSMTACGIPAAPPHSGCSTSFSTQCGRTRRVDLSGVGSNGHGAARREGSRMATHPPRAALSHHPIHTRHCTHRTPLPTRIEHDDARFQTGDTRACTQECRMGVWWREGGVGVRMHTRRHPYMRPLAPLNMRMDAHGWRSTPLSGMSMEYSN